MRFDIAAGILALTLPATSETTNSVAQQRKKLQALLREPSNAGQVTKKKQVFRKQSGSALFSFMGNKRRLEGSLTNSELNSGVECDPKTFADVGILSCGNGEYCMESENSALGGVCVDTNVQKHRGLQTNSWEAYCNGTAAADNDYISECDCEQFDQNIETGSIHCVIFTEDNPYCFSYVGCNNTCASADLELNVFPDGNYSYAYCYNFFSPYDQQVCFGSQTSNLETCTLYLNGEKCSSCEAVYVPPFIYETTYGNWTWNYTLGGYACEHFDCTNVGGGLSGNLCEDFYSVLPILKTCVDPPIDTPAPTPADPEDMPTPDILVAGKPGVGDTAAPTMEPTMADKSGVPHILSNKGAHFGLISAIAAYFVL